MVNLTENVTNVDKRVPWRPVIVNLLIVGIFGLVVLFLEIFGVPTRRGFFCHDESIKYPYRSNTVSEVLIVLGVITLPVFVFLANEFWANKSCTGGKIRVWKIALPIWVQSTFSIYGPYLMGLGLTQIISGVGKFTIGRLRPHFMEVCQPDVQCNSSMTNYILNYTCTGDTSMEIETRLSFPSGHASLSFFTCIFLTMYLQASCKWRSHKLLRGLVQFLLVLTAWWIALSRVMDYWHHWSDVFAGSILGCAAAYLTARYLTDLGKLSEAPNEEFLPLQTATSTNCP